MRSWSWLFALLVVEAGAVPVLAQTNSQPPVRGRWALSSAPQPRPVNIHVNLPAACDAPTFRAIDTWNAAGSNLKFQFNDYTTTRLATSDASDIQMEDGARDTATLASTFWTINEYTAIPTITDADIIVNTDKIFYGTHDTGVFYCDYPNTLSTANYDYQSVMLHEFGHVGGFRHGTNTSCPMYESIAKGQTRRVLCSGESTLWKDLYDPAINPY